MADVKVIEDIRDIKAARSPHDKAFLRVTIEDGTKIDLSLNLAAMIGGVAVGTIQRLGYE